MTVMQTIRVLCSLLFISCLAPYTIAQDASEEERAFLEFIEALSKEIEKEQRGALATQEINAQPIERTTPKIPEYLDPSKEVAQALSLTDKRANFLTSFIPPEQTTQASKPGEGQPAPSQPSLPNLQKEALLYYVGLFITQLQKLERSIAQLSQPQKIMFNNAIEAKSNGKVSLDNIIPHMIVTLENIQSKATYRMTLYDPAFVALRDRIIYYTETLKSLRDDIDTSNAESIKTKRALDKLQNIIATEFPACDIELGTVMTQASKSIAERKTFRETRYKQMQEQFKRLNETIARQEQAARYRQQYSQEQTRKPRQGYPEYGDYDGGYGGYYGDGGFSAPWTDKDRAATEAKKPEEKKPEPKKEEPKKEGEKKPEDKSIGEYINLVKRFGDTVSQAGSATAPETRSALIENATKLAERAEEVELKVQPSTQKTKPFLDAKGKYKTAKEKFKILKAQEKGAETPKEPTRAPGIGPKPGSVTGNISVHGGTFMILAQGADTEHGAYSGYYALYNALCLTLDTEPFTKNALSNRALFEQWLRLWENQVRLLRKETDKQKRISDLSFSELSALRDWTIKQMSNLTRAQKELYKTRIICLDIMGDQFDIEQIIIKLASNDILNALSNFKNQPLPLSLIINSGSTPLNLLDTTEQAKHWIVITCYPFKGKVQTIIADSLGEAKRHSPLINIIEHGINNPGQLELHAEQIGLLREINAIIDDLQPLWDMKDKGPYSAAEAQDILRQAQAKWARQKLLYPRALAALDINLIMAFREKGKALNDLVSNLMPSRALTNTDEKALSNATTAFERSIENIISVVEKQVRAPLT